MMIKLSKKNIYLTVAATVMAVCIMVSAGVVILGPHRKAIRAIDNRIKELESILKTSGNSGNINALNQKLFSEQKSLSKYVISPKQASDLTVDIGKIAKQAGVQDIRSTNRMQGSYKPLNECQYICEGRIQINFKSSFSQFAEFVNLLERNEPVIFIDTFKIARSTKNDGMHSVDIALAFFCSQNNLTDGMDAEISSDPVPATGTGKAVN